MKVTNIKIRDIFAYILVSVLVVLGIFSLRGISSAAPTVSITSPTAGQVLSSGSFSVIGTATANSVVQLHNGNKFLGATTSDGSGNWSIDVSGLSNGALTLTAKAISKTEYAYFPTTPDFATGDISRLTIVDDGNDILNEGGAPWPIETDAVGGFLSGAGCVPNGTKCIILALSPGTPSIIDIDSPAVPVAVSGYQAGSGSRTGTFSPTDGRTYYGVNYTTDNISVVDLVDNLETTFDGVVDDPQAAAVSADGTTLYVSHVGPTATSPTKNDIAVINATTGVKSKDIAVGCPTNESAGSIVTLGEILYVACALDNEVRKIDPITGAVLATYDFSASRTKIGTLQITPDGKKLYVSDVWDGVSHANETTITSYNLETNTTTVISGLTAAYFAGIVSPGGRYVYVGTPSTDFSGTNIDVISTATDTIVENIDTSSLGVAGVVFFGPQSSTTTTVSITVNASSSETLANTGQSATYILLASISLITLGGAYLRKQYR